MSVNWDDFRFLLAFQREGSLKAAARTLGVEPSTASRRLAALENSLGVQLAARTPEGLVMNDAGVLAGELAQTMDAGIEALVRRIGGEDERPEGVVRLSTTGSMSTFLMRGLSTLADEHPKIRVELVMSSAALDLARREADVALRLFREQTPALITRKIGEIGWSVYASRGYLERSGLTPGAIADEQLLIGQSVVGFRGPAGRSGGAKWLNEHSRPDQVVLQAESTLSVITAVSAGIGISVLPCFLVEHTTPLVRLTPSVVATVEAFVVIPADHRNTVRVRIVMDALADLFARERALLSGAA